MVSSATLARKDTTARIPAPVAALLVVLGNTKTARAKLPVLLALLVKYRNLVLKLAMIVALGDTKVQQVAVVIVLQERTAQVLPMVLVKRVLETPTLMLRLALVPNARPDQKEMVVLVASSARLARTLQVETRALLVLLDSTQVQTVKVAAHLAPRVPTVPKERLNVRTALLDDTTQTLVIDNATIA